jgi:uncharacterized membrane protein
MKWYWHISEHLNLRNGRKTMKQTSTAGIGMVIGCALGIILGTMYNQVGLGIALGTALGLLVGYTMPGKGKVNS